jgi:hypothetical protein
MLFYIEAQVLKGVLTCEEQSKSVSDLSQGGSAGVISSEEGVRCEWCVEGFTQESDRSEWRVSRSCAARLRE